MLVKRGKRKIPGNAVEPLTQTCEILSGAWGKPAAEIFKSFLELMNRYADYFFSEPWPEKYDYEEATTFTDEDVNFLLEGEGDFADRCTAVSLRKNMNLEHGFMGCFGMFWTQQALHEKFVRPRYRPVLEVFGALARVDEDARKVLSGLKEQFSAKLIHDSLIDLLEHTCPDESTRRLVEEVFELLHGEEGLPPCKDYRCSWWQRQR